MHFFFYYFCSWAVTLIKCSVESRNKTNFIVNFQRNVNSRHCNKTQNLSILYKLWNISIWFIGILPHNNDNFGASEHMTYTMNLYKHTLKNDNIDTCIRKPFSQEIKYSIIYSFFFYFFRKINCLLLQNEYFTCKICST